MPVIRCPHCSTSVEIHPDDVGYKLLCPNCQSAFQAGDVERPGTEPEPVPVENLAASTAELPMESNERTVICFACKEEIQVGVEDIGHRVECPLCKAKFTAKANRSQSRYQVDLSRDDFDDDYDYEDRRYSRNRYRAESKADILDAARRAIAVPANGMMWTGIIAAVLCVLIGIGLTVAGIIEEQQPRRFNGDRSLIFFIYAGLFGVYGTILQTVLAVCGAQAKKLNGKGWGYTGAALGIACIIITHPCNPVSWASITFGIWMIVSLNKREVQDAIDINTGKRPRNARFR
jgi:uncharacterized CHY-type Zn-finger protein